VSELVHQNVAALAKTAKPAPACTLVIFGAGGDLTKRLLMPYAVQLGWRQAAG
jgi:glucose-6-phosphate 1-dehydrogenase